MATITTDIIGAQVKRAVIHRMVRPDHLCPSGLKALDLLRQHGFEIEDHPLVTREATEAFKAAHDVKTTPQVWIGGERIGGYDAMRAHLGRPLADPKALTYRPVIALFGMALAIALAASWAATGEVLTWRALQWLGGVSTALLALQKLRDVEGFTNGFLTYDLLARARVRYAYAYPWLEGGVGVLMIAGALPWLTAPVALVIGSIGAVSVWKAVYVEKRELKCACMGAASNVPLGFVSLSENLLMIVMGVWMAVGMPMAT